MSVFETDDKTAAATKEKETAPTPAPKKTTNDNKSGTTNTNKPANNTNNAPKQNNQGQSGGSKPQATTGHSKPQQQNNNNDNNQQHVFQKATSTSAGQNTQQQSHQNKPKPTSTAGTGEHLMKLRLKGKDTEGVTNLTGEFDFTEGLSHFNKTEVLAKVASETHTADVEPVEVKYVKDDFFDMLSNDATGKGKSVVIIYQYYDRLYIRFILKLYEEQNLSFII